MFVEELKLVPKKSGCYLMKNKNNVVIYVGKAKNLFNRLKSYFNGRAIGKTAVLVSEISYFEYIVTNSELEAFILELNLIKKYDPKYNILLKDDKSYPYIEITNEKYPRLIVKRDLNVKKKNSNVFGPYQNAYAARKIVNLLNRIYPLRKCVTLPSKVCLYYHIGECNGYCENKNIDDTYIKNEIVKILNGNSDILINKIDEKIEKYSNDLNYEQALYLKNELEYLKVIFSPQDVELKDGINRDIINYYVNNGYISFEIFFLRNGKLIGSVNNIKPLVSDINEELNTYIGSFYNKNIVPKELIVPETLDVTLLSKLLNTKVVNVSKGIKKRLFDLTGNNAKINMENEINLILNNRDKVTKANEELKNILGLEELEVIEAFDNSNLFGTFTVSGMVVFKNGFPSKKDYRKYKISVEKNDDVLAMKEVIYRRYYRVLMENLKMPDLIIVDGGINQINACVGVLKSLNLDIKVCGIKKDIHHNAEYLIDGSNLKLVPIDKKTNLFHYITRISEEVHNYTINYHKTIRSKSNISSLLDNIPGVGEKRKKMLIKKYGSLRQLKEVDIKQLEEIVPHEVASNIYNYLKSI